MAKSPLSWWPVADEAALLDLRQGLCQLTLWKRDQGGIRNYSEPAYVRRGVDGTTTHWGRRASIWRERLPGLAVERLFPSGWPVEAGAARGFLRRFYEVHLSQTKVGKVYVVESTGIDWVRELWRETLEDSSLALLGFLTDWQHDALVVRGDPEEVAVSQYLHFSLTESGCHWSFIDKGQIVAVGADDGLSRTRLVREIRQFGRANSIIELPPGEARRLLSHSCLSRTGTSNQLELELFGRHVLSGLPTRQVFRWDEFLATKPAIVAAWQAVKRRVFAQARDLTGGKLELATAGSEGLDLPGWWVLTPGTIEGLFVEGPVVRLMDAAL